MHKMGEASLKRGEKWTKIRELYAFQKRDKDVTWLDSQKSIVADMKEYADSLPKETKSEKKK